VAAGGFGKRPAAQRSRYWVVLNFGAKASASPKTRLLPKPLETLLQAPLPLRDVHYRNRDARVLKQHRNKIDDAPQDKSHARDETILKNFWNSLIRCSVVRTSIEPNSGLDRVPLKGYCGSVSALL
jgi:hypothetical protein